MKGGIGIGISRNINITWDIIQNNPNKPWNWLGISINPNITWDIIINNPWKRWKWHQISLNPNITMEIIKNNPEKNGIGEIYQLELNSQSR